MLLELPFFNELIKTVFFNWEVGGARGGNVTYFLFAKNPYSPPIVGNSYFYRKMPIYIKGYWFSNSNIHSTKYFSRMIISYLNHWKKKWKKFFLVLLKNQKGKMVSPWSSVSFLNISYTISFKSGLWQLRDKEGRR